MTQQSAVTEARILEGPNLYFTRPAVKITLRASAALDIAADELHEVGHGLGVRGKDAGEVGTEARRRYVVRFVERLIRLLVTDSGPRRVGIRVRPGEQEDELDVVVALNNRGRAAALAEALAPLLDQVLVSDDPRAVIAALAADLRQGDPGPKVRALRPRIPVVAVTGTNGKTTTTRLVAHLAMGAGLHTAWSSTDGVLADGELVDGGDYSGPGGARAVLATPGVQFAVLETARGGMLRRGLGTATNDVSVVTNVSADHLGVGGIHTLDQLAEVKAIITKVTKPTGWVVLNGEDPRVWTMRTSASGRPWCFALSADSPALREALEAHGRGITVIDGDIAVLEPGASPDRLVSLLDVPMTLSGLSEHNIANALAGAAAGLGAGLSRDAVIAGLRTFAPDAQHNPGRMNIYTLPLERGGTVTVILDMAHNEAGLEALLRVARGIRPPGSALQLGLGTGGDRTDEILVNMGEMAGLQADRVQIAHKDHYLRGRSKEELEGLLREGLWRAGARPTASWPDELNALQGLLGASRDGDVIALMTHEDWSLLHRWLLEHGATADGADVIRRKVVTARGEHEAEEEIAGLWLEQDPDRRIAMAKDLQRRYPTDGRVLYELAGTHDSAGQEQQALELYDRAMLSDLREPYRHRALIQKASTLRHLGRLEESLRVLDRLVAEYPDNTAIVLFRALTLHDLGRDVDGLRSVAMQLAATSGDTDVQRYQSSLTRFTQEIR